MFNNRFCNFSGQETGTLKGHTKEVISVNFDNTGCQLITGSFDGTVSVWDTRTNKYNTKKYH